MRQILGPRAGTSMVLNFHERLLVCCERMAVTPFEARAAHRKSMPLNDAVVAKSSRVCNPSTLTSRVAERKCGVRARRRGGVILIADRVAVCAVGGGQRGACCSPS